MESITIAAPEDNRYPFTREMFEEGLVLYHGSWSSWIATIDREGFAIGNIPFDWRLIATIFDARKAIGCGSILSLFLGDDYPSQQPSPKLYFAADFWVARSYAVTKGGEVVEEAIKEADQFEQVCSTEARWAIKARWDAALRFHGEHALTRAASEALGDEQRLNALRMKVREAKKELVEATVGGHPVVYAVRVEREWFETSWEDLPRVGIASIRQNLRCNARYIPADRILARADYPNGTDPHFAEFRTNWDEVSARKPE
ncbi:MAG: hypothetical protein ACLQBA_24090 [Candidatus Binataceae bacterium]